MINTEPTAEARYLALSPARDRYLERARDCSELTIPALIPRERGNQGNDIPVPVQSNGAKGVNSLSSKLLLAMMPPNIPVFRLEKNEVAEKILASQDPQVAKAAEEVKENLDRIPRAALLLTETYDHRPVIFEGMKHLIVGGNILFWFLDAKPHQGKIRAVPLSRYCVLRDSIGFVLEVVIQDTLNAANLPPKLAAILQTKKTEEEILKEASQVRTESPSSPYYLYTYACWDPKTKKYNFKQEFMGETVEGSTARYTVDSFPLVPLRFSASDGEDYGRGLVEEYRGNLQSIEAISQSETALAIVMSEVRWAVSAASPIRSRDLNASPQGAYIDAEPDSIKAISAEKYGDLAAVAASKQSLQRDFDMAFLVSTSIQRPGERVTAEEIRTMMQLLDSTLGGLYSSLAAEFQRPYVQFQLRLLKATQGIDIGKSGAIRPRIVTGIEALGQSAEAMQFVESQKVLSDLISPAEYARVVNADAIAKKINGYWNVESAGLYKNQEQLAQEQAARDQAEQNKAAVAPIIGAVSKATSS